MKNAGLRITAETFREDNTVAQTVLFDQRGLTYAQLLELQSKAVLPLAQTVLEVMARWGQEAAAGNASGSPTSPPKA